jgi:hypothetical protein
VAVIVALELLLTVAVVALKVAELAAAATVADVGNVSTELVLERVTLAPPLVAGWLKVMVQVAEELEPTLAGLQTSDDTNTGATRVTIVLTELVL